MQLLLYTMRFLPQRTSSWRSPCPDTRLNSRQRPAMMSSGAGRQITIRDLKSIDDLIQLKGVEKEVWRMADDDTIPLTLAIACKAAGNIFVGAFDTRRSEEHTSELQSLRHLVCR